jgi:hypothetical protein
MAITTKYLAAVFQVFFNECFQYVHELTSDQAALLEFELELDGNHKCSSRTTTT